MGSAINWIRKNSLAGWLLLWSSLIYGALQIHFHGNLSRYSICGPWGCGPTANTLLAIHLMWLAILLPPAVYLQWRAYVSQFWMRRIAWLMMIASISAVIIIILWQWLVWLPAAGPLFRSYIWQRCGFAVLNTVDWPWLQILIAGLCIYFFPRSSTHSSPRKAQTVVVEHPDHQLYSLKEKESSIPKNSIP